MPNSGGVVIGRVIGTHGVRGQIKVVPETDYPERFLEMEELRFFRRGKMIGTYGLEEARFLQTRGSFLLKLTGINDLDSAAVLKDCTVEISPEERVELEPGEVWASDIIGCTVYNEENDRLGTVARLDRNGPTEFLIIRDDDGKDHMIPSVPEFLLDADPVSKKVIVHLIDGLWNL